MRLCFAILPQANFPAHNMNFHWRWSWWLPFKTFSTLQYTYKSMLQILLDLWWIFFFFFSFRQLKLEFAQLELTQDFVMSELQSKKSWKVMKLNWREKRIRYTKTFVLFVVIHEIWRNCLLFQSNGFKAFLSLIIF